MYWPSPVSWPLATDSWIKAHSPTGIALSTYSDTAIAALHRFVLKINNRDRDDQVSPTPRHLSADCNLTMDNLTHPLIALYRDHATSEQFHSELKTDLDIERLPSGKFATNVLVMTLAIFSYNMLRWIGLISLVGDISPVRHPAKRRRLRTVIQELMYLAARLIKTSRRLTLRFCRHCPGSLPRLFYGISPINKWIVVRPPPPCSAAMRIDVFAG